MLKKIFTNQLNHNMTEYYYARSNTFNIFVKNKDNKKLMIDLYSSAFKYLLKLDTFTVIINNLNKYKKNIKIEEQKYNTILSRNKKELVKQLDISIFEKYETELQEQEIEIKKIEKLILEETERLRVLNDYHSLNFDTFIYFLKNNYDDKVQKDFRYMLKNITDQDKIMFNIIYYLVKYNLNKILKEVINHYNLNKNEVSVIIESENLELILLLIEKHSNKIVKFDIIYNTFLFNREKVSKMNINSTNAYIKYIHSHIITNKSL